MSFAELTNDQQNALAKEVQDAANSVGGENPFLTIVEDIKSAKPAVMVAKENSYVFADAQISWNKTIFQDRYNYLRDVVRARKFEANFVPSKGEKSFKNILNLVRLLKPLHFMVNPKDSDYAGFEFDAFIMDGDQVNATWLFLALFFLPIGLIKEALNFKYES